MTKKWNWFTLLHSFVRFSSMFQKAQGSGKISLFIKVKTNPVTIHTCKTHTCYIKLKESGFLGGVVRRITYQTGLHIGDKKIKDFEFQLLSIY